MLKIILITLLFTVEAYSITKIEVENTWKKVVSAFYTELIVSGESIEFVWTQEDITNVAAINYTIPRRIFVSKKLLNIDSLRQENIMNIFCHEIGHVIGGAPFIEEYPGDNRKISTEGQADYFATAKCMKRLIKEHEYSDNIIPKEDQLSLLGKGCDTKKCQLIAYFSYMTLNILEENDREFSLESHAEEITDYTFGYKNSSQCRLDTFIAGSICNVSENLNFSPTVQSMNACHWRSQDTYFLLGARPICWFRPFILDSFY